MQRATQFIRQHGWQVSFVLWAAMVALCTVSYGALADSVGDVSAVTEGHTRITFEVWQAEFALLAPVGIAMLLHLWGTLSSAPLTTARRKGLASVVTLMGAVVGLIVTGAFDDFVPSLVTIVGLLLSTQNSYDKLWQAIPGLSNMIIAIDPGAKP